MFSVLHTLTGNEFVGMEVRQRLKKAAHMGRKVGQRHSHCHCLDRHHCHCQCHTHCLGCHHPHCNLIGRHCFILVLAILHCDGSAWSSSSFFCLLMNSVILLLAISSGGRGDLGKTKIENVLFLGRSSLICFKYFHTHTHAFGLDYHHPSRLWSPATNTSATTIFFNSSKTTT